MRIDINLASQPYEDSQQFWLRWGGALGAVALLTIVLLVVTVDGWFNARRDHKQMAELRGQIAKCQEQRQHAEQILNEPVNRATRDQSQFLNQLIERKAFSWTRVLEAMEKVMPARLHLVSITPELDDDNQLYLKMVVAGDSRDRGIELAKRMEDSRRFSQTYVSQETLAATLGATGPDKEKDTVKFSIDAVYVPEPLLPAENSDKEDSKTDRNSQSAPPSNTGTQNGTNEIAKRRKP